MNQTTYRLLEGQKDVKKKMGSLMSLVLQGVGAAMGGADQVLSGSGGDGIGATAAGTIADSATAIGDSLDLEGGSGIAGGMDAASGLSAPLTNVGPGGGQMTSGFNSPRMSMKSPAGNALIQVGRGFGKGLGLGGGSYDGGVGAFNQKVALFDYEQQKKQEDQIADEARAREDFKFKNAEGIKQKATDEFIAINKVTPEQRPDLYEKFVNQYADQAFNTAMATSKAGEATANKTFGADNEAEKLRSLTEDDRVQLGTKTARANLNRFPIDERAREATSLAVPAEKATGIFKDSTKPFMGGSLSLDVNSGDTTRYSPPDEKANLGRLLAGKTPLGETATAFGGGAPITLSNGMTIPAKSKPDGILSRVLGNSNTRFGLSGGNSFTSSSSADTFSEPEAEQPFLRSMGGFNLYPPRQTSPQASTPTMSNGRVTSTITPPQTIETPMEQEIKRRKLLELLQRSLSTGQY